jgi:hypothetical protein
MTRSRVVFTSVSSIPKVSPDSFPCVIGCKR